jgi:hypothetical protein
MRLSQRTLFSVSTLSACMLLPAVAHAGFVNGGFEGPGLLGGRQNITTAANAPTGWVPSGFLQNESLFYQRTGEFANLVAKDGTFLVGFGGNGTTGGRIGQTFDTVAGATYTVNFFTTAQQSGTGAQSYLAEALGADGTTLLGSDSAAIPVGDNNWVGHVFSFVATGASSTLRFTDTSNGAAAVGINWALDAVSVGINGPATVPEPSTLLLVLACAGLLFAPTRRRV